MEGGESFNPQSYMESREQRYGAPKRQQKYVSGAKNGAWSDLQHSMYIVYMEQHREQMRSRESRRINKFYKGMANYIGTRNPLQCRSHHQKLEDKLRYPNKIIAHFKKHHDLTDYHRLRQIAVPNLPQLPPPPSPDLKRQEDGHNAILRVEKPQPSLNLSVHSPSGTSPGASQLLGGQGKEEGMVREWAGFRGMELMAGWGLWNGEQYYPIVLPQVHYYH